MPKTPYQINDWEVTSYKNEPMNLWKYFHKNGNWKIVDDAEYVLLSDLALGQGDIEKILKENPHEHIITHKFKLSIFGRVTSKVGQLLFSGHLKPYFIRNHCVFIIKKSMLEDKDNFLNLEVQNIDSFENQIKKPTIGQLKNTWYLLRYFNPGLAQLLLFGIVGIIGMALDLTIVTFLRELLGLILEYVASLAFHLLLRPTTYSTVSSPSRQQM